MGTARLRLAAFTNRPESFMSLRRARPSSRRRVVLALAAVAVLIAAILTVTRFTSSGTVACRVSSTGAPSCGPWWGLAQNVTNSALPAAVQTEEAASGRRLDIVHTYHRWYDPFPTAAERSIAADGSLLFLNWEPTDQSGRPMAWTAIAQGIHDQQIDALAGALKSLPTVLLSFSHEPELDYGQHGTEADFVAAFRHIHNRLAADGVTNVRYVWDLEGLTDPVWLARYASLWPGASYVDWIAWDPYNWADCRAGHGRPDWQTFSQTVQPFYDWLEGHGYGSKPFMLGEYGSVEKAGDPGAKATWLDQIPSALKSMPNLRALVYFDVPAPPANCNWQVTTSAAATQAFARLATSGPFQRTAALDPAG
jgi:hypothetical protein